MSEQTAAFILYNIDCCFITEVEIVYCAVSIETLYRRDKFHLLKG